MKTWMIWMLLLPNGAPTADEARFTNQSGCELYLHTQYTEDIVHTFKLACVDVSPTMCQDNKPCE